MTPDTFNSADMDALLATGGFGGLPAEVAFDAIASAVNNPVDDAGRPVPVEAFDRSAAESYLVGEYSRAAVPRAVERAMSAVAAEDAARRNATAQSVVGATGVSPAEYTAARMARDAGDPSDLLRIYSRFIRRR